VDLLKNNFLLDFNLYIDLIGYIAIVFSIISFLSKDKVKMRLNGAISTLLFGISIYFYNGVNGLFVSIVSFSIKILSLNIKEEKLKSIKIIMPFVALFFFFFFNKEGLVGILPAISLIFIAFADIQKDILKMKIIYYGSAFSWLIYGIILGSIPAIIFDIIGIITLTISIYNLKKIKGNK
jgi:hypothetical protein